MGEYLTPGVYVEEVSTGARPIAAVGTTTAAFIGTASKDFRRGEPVQVVNWGEFRDRFMAEAPRATPFENAVAGFFLNGGSRAYVVNVAGVGDIPAALERLAALDDVAMVAAPGLCDFSVADLLLTFCERQGSTSFAILDGPADSDDLGALTRVGAPPADGDRKGKADAGDKKAEAALRPRESERGYGAVYFPHIQIRDARDPSALVTIPPSGHIAGMFARNDTERGVHKAPANMVVRGALGLSRRLTDAEQGQLNPKSVNVIRFFTGRGTVLWGGRTLAAEASEWRYVPIRRFFTMVETSIKRGTDWVVFEPNDERLWKSIRRDVSSFLTLLWRQGALMGSTPEQAFFVKCDAETNTQDVIDAGRVVIEIGLAPVKPAEFVIFRIGHAAPDVI